MKNNPIEKHLYLYKDHLYPKYLKDGHAAKYILPIAREFCKGKGLDIGGKKDCQFPGALIINTEYNSGYSANILPDKKYDYIFSSHTLEHISTIGLTLQYWRLHLKPLGVLFLYLPHPDMLYWLPENCQKHKHSFTPEEITTLLIDAGFTVIMRSCRDSFWSFAIAAIKTREE